MVPLSLLRWSLHFFPPRRYGYLRVSSLTLSNLRNKNIFGSLEKMDSNKLPVFHWGTLVSPVKFFLKAKTSRLYKRVQVEEKKRFQDVG